MKITIRLNGLNRRAAYRFAKKTEWRTYAEAIPSPLEWRTVHIAWERRELR